MWLCGLCVSRHTFESHLEQCLFAFEEIESRAKGLIVHVVFVSTRMNKTQ